MPALLLDSCVWGNALPPLVQAGHDVVWAGTWPEDPGDAAILARAHADRRILVTLDKDFGELAILRGHPHCGIIRLAGFRANQMAAAIDHLVSTYHADLAAGAVITADPQKVRIRGT